jgi:hypothetical protein
VLINTYLNSKLAYLYTVAATLFISPIFLIAVSVLTNWWAFCKVYPSENPKCLENPSNHPRYFKNIFLALNICGSLYYCFYHIGHFLFAYRYFEVAEMFGRDDKTMEKHIQIRKITQKISYVCIAIIVLNFLIDIIMWINWRISGELSMDIDHWTLLWIPCFFLLIDCILLLIGIIWICNSLRYDKQVMGNEKWMAVHTALLSITLGS